MRCTFKVAISMDEKACPKVISQKARVRMASRAV